MQEQQLARKKLSASVNASRKAKDPTSILTANRGIRYPLQLLFRKRALSWKRALRKIQEAATFEFEPRPQALRFGSWKISFRGEVMSGSSHPKLVGVCLAEFDCAASMDDLVYLGFTFDSHQTVFGTKDSQTVKGIAKIIPAG